MEGGWVVVEHIPGPDSEADRDGDAEVIRLELMLAEPSDDVDVPSLTGLLGIAWLDRYEREGDGRALADGLTCLWNALMTAPDHPDRNRWFYWLGLGYGERGRRHHAVGDYHRAIGCVSNVLLAPADDRPGRNLATTTLSELCWERFWYLRHGPAYDRVAAMIAVDELIATVEPLLSAENEPALVRGIRRIMGLAHLERYELRPHRSDLDRGISLLATAGLWDLPSDTPNQVMAAVELTDAYRRRALLDGDSASLDLAIEAGATTLERLGDDDRLSRLMLHHSLALAHEARWRLEGTGRDLDQAIEGWRTLMRSDPHGRPDASEAAGCGDLLRERGELTGDPVDIAESIVLLQLAAGAS